MYFYPGYFLPFSLDGKQGAGQDDVYVVADWLKKQCQSNVYGCRWTDYDGLLVHGVEALQTPVC